MRRHHSIMISWLDYTFRRDAEFTKRLPCATGLPRRPCSLLTMTFLQSFLRWCRLGVPLLLALAFPVVCDAAVPVKTLRLTFQAAETGFDPAKVADYYSGTVIESIFEPLLT